MAEVTLQPATSPNSDSTVGDAVFQPFALSVDWDETVHVVGKDAEKTPTSRASVSHYSTSIPLGSVVNKAKIEVVATESDDDSFSVDVDVLALTTKLDSASVSHHEAQFIYLPDYGGFPIASIWDDGRGSGNDHRVPMPLNFEHGVGSISQAWTADVSDEALYAHYWWAERTGSMTSTDMITKVYEASGSAGSYTKGTLVEAGQTRSASSISDSGMGSFYTLPASGAWTPTSGATYISELSFSGGSGSVAAEVGILTTASGGSSENASVYSASGYSLQGFGGYAQWLTGTQISDAAKQGTTDTVSSFPSFDSGELYGFGHADYDSGNYTELTNLTANIQSALSARTTTSQWIGIRWDSSVSTSDRERKFRSSKHSSATAGGKFGMLLTIDYTAPGAETDALSASGESVSTATGSGASISGATGSGESVASLKGSSE